MIFIVNVCALSLSKYVQARCYEHKSLSALSLLLPWWLSSSPSPPPSPLPLPPAHPPTIHPYPPPPKLHVASLLSTN